MVSTGYLADTMVSVVGSFGLPQHAFDLLRSARDKLRRDLLYRVVMDICDQPMSSMTARVGTPSTRSMVAAV